MSLITILKFITNHPIAKHSKVKSVFRFFAWQFRGLITTKPYIHQFTQNAKLIISKGMTGATGNLYCGLHEYKEMLFLMHYLRKDELFIDIGANIGSFSILASAEIEAFTYSFEPVRNTFEQLKANILLNKLENRVHYFNIGLASKKGELIFSDEHDSSMNHVVSAENSSSKTIKVKVETLNDVLLNKNPSLLKIDVEGFELEVLRGATDILSKPSLKAIIIELNNSGLNYGYTDEEIHQLLLSYEFQSFSYDPFNRTIAPTNLHEHYNLIYIRDVEVVKQKLNTSPKVKILNLEI